MVVLIDALNAQLELTQFLILLVAYLAQKAIFAMVVLTQINPILFNIIREKFVQKVCIVQKVVLSQSSAHQELTIKTLEPRVLKIAHFVNLEHLKLFGDRKDVIHAGSSPLVWKDQNSALALVQIEFIHLLTIHADVRLDSTSKMKIVLVRVPLRIQLIVFL